MADAIALHEALGGDEDAVLIGHDWGAETAYGAASFAPNRWRRLVSLAIPPLTLDDRMFEDYDQLKRFFYLFFIKAADAEAVIAADDMAFLDRLWHDWSPGYDATDDLRTVKQCLREPQNLSAALSYYRANDPLGHDDDTSHAYVAEGRALLMTPPQPTLYLHGDRDGCVDVAFAAGTEGHLAPGSATEIIEGAGHFLQLERPAAVNERIVAWVTG